MKFKNTKILYTYTARRSFVVKDLALLEKHFNVTTYFFRTSIRLLMPISFLLQGLYLLFFGWRYRYIIAFFAGYHSVLPAIFSRWSKRKCIIFLGGTDCFYYPSFHYGNFTKKWYGKATCISAHNASLLVPVSENLILSESAYYEGDPATQGIYQWCAPLKTPNKIIPLEYDPELFYRHSVERKSNSFITVAFGIEGSSFIRKGIDKVVMLATHLPQFEFTIIGCRKEDFPVSVPSNVSLIPPVPYAQLPVYYSMHEFYIQLSIAEGFPSSICEAMLCECIPIGSDVAAIPVIISTHGFIVSKRDDTVILLKVEEAIRYSSKEDLGRNAREHIISTFGPGTREAKLLTAFDATRT